MQEVLNKWSFSLSFWLWRVRQDRCLVTTSVSHLSQCGWPHPPGALPPGHTTSASVSPGSVSWLSLEPTGGFRVASLVCP